MGQAGHNTHLYLEFILFPLGRSRSLNSYNNGVIVYTFYISPVLYSADKYPNVQILQNTFSAVFVSLIIITTDQLYSFQHLY